MRSILCCFQSVKVKKFESNSQRSTILCHSLYCWFQSGKDKRNTFIRYFSRVFFPESVFGYVTACPFRSDHLENPLPSEDADEVNRFYVVVPAPARSRIVNLRLHYVFIVIPSGECRLKTKDLHGSPGRFLRSRFRIPVGMPRRWKFSSKPVKTIAHLQQAFLWTKVIIRALHIISNSRCNICRYTCSNGNASEGGRKPVCYSRCAQLCPTWKMEFFVIYYHSNIYPFYSTAGVPFLPLQEFKFTIINLEYICG